MRRSIGLVLVGLGVLMLVLAPLSRWYAYPRLAVVPNDVAERVSTGSDVTVLDLGAVVRQEAEVERVTDVRSVRRIIPDQGESSGDTAVWDTSVTNFDALGEGATPEENVLSYYEERVAFDRHSSESVDGNDQYYTPTGERADRVEVDHEGYYFKLPFGVEQRSYPFWDSTIQETRPMEFQSETTLEGLPVYVFQQVIEPTPVSALEIPGALFGQAGSIVADRIYSTTRTLWVEPQTGAIIKGQEEQDSYLDFEGTRGPTIVQGTLAYTGEQVTANVDEYASSAEQLELARDTIPVSAAAAGGVLMILGLVLARRRSYDGKRRAPLPEDDGVSGGFGGGGSVAGAGREAGIVAGSTVMSRAAEEQLARQRPQTRSPEPVRSYEPPRVAPYEAPRYDDVYTRRQLGEPVAGSNRDEAAVQRQYEPRTPQYAQPAESVVEETPAAPSAASAADPAEATGKPRTRADRIAAAMAEPAAPAAPAAQPPATPPTEQAGEQPPAGEPKPLPRRPQASAVRPPVGRPHVQPVVEPTQRDAALERTRSDLARLEQARAELARFAEEHPDLAGDAAATPDSAATSTPSAPEPAPELAPERRPAAESRPATPAQSGRRRARDDDGLFDEFDEDGQSAGSLHRY
ncbi:porin PorA family protein [Jiangella mangrovi]|uniref:DUF3068 domain-containing protein n=1 Tax=Jiangella mangrovi TaxID=1524084 RepID=A0A7W9GT94_9ACTN|nr:porin PorA family protein [Jiangella mangrovi]MBB5789633.1 hypothetical protein [Jiangella mangrovi]